MIQILSRQARCQATLITAAGVADPVLQQSSPSLLLLPSLASREAASRERETTARVLPSRCPVLPLAPDSQVPSCDSTHSSLTLARPLTPS